MKKSNKWLIISIVTLLFLAVSVVGVLTYQNFRQNIDSTEVVKGVSCGGWDTSGEVICKCSGELIKPSCPPNVICDSGDYYCKGRCTDCCYKGIADNHPLPKCNK